MTQDNEYTTSKVQPKDFISGWWVALIISGTALSLPILYLGAEIALGLGLKDALISFIVSTLILTVMSCITTLIGNRTHLSTYMILHFSFGKNGAKIVNFIFGVILIGWFSVSLELLAIAIQDTALNYFGLKLPTQLIIILGSVFITLTTLFGIQSIQRLANIAVPILTIFLLYVFYLSIQKVDSFDYFLEYLPQSNDLNVFKAISVLVGSSILFPVLMADFSRFIKNDKQSFIAVLGLAIGTPFALVIASIPAIETGEVDIIKIISNYELVLPAFMLLFISTWVANSVNLYSATLTFSTLNTKWPYKTVTVIGSLLGTLIALLGILDYLFNFLEILGTFAPAISSIYVIHFFFVKKQNYNINEIEQWGREALLSLFLSSVITVFTFIEYFTITSVYFIDSFILGGVFYTLLMRKQFK